MKAANQRLCFGLLPLCEARWESPVAKREKTDHSVWDVRRLAPAPHILAASKLETSLSLPALQLEVLPASDPNPSHYPVWIFFAVLPPAGWGLGETREEGKGTVERSQREPAPNATLVPGTALSIWHILTLLQFPVTF